MIRNYFITAYRNLWHNGQFTLINIAGLALGISVFLFIMQYVAFEESANRFNKNYNQLYRTNVLYKEGNSDYHLPPGFASIIKQRFPQIENYVRVADGIASGVITYKSNGTQANKVFSQTSINYVDGNFLSVFSFPVIAGNQSLSLSKTLALSETISKKIFGSSNAIGKTVTISNQFGNTLYTVNAVYQLPANSDIKADILLSIKTLENTANRNGNDWADPNGTDNGFTSIYLQLRKDAAAETVAQNITQFVRSINPNSKTDVIYLQPFSALHLAPSLNYPFQTFGNLLLVIVFASIAFLILLIAWLNYINLSTAQALNRIKDMGMRKILGASRGQLILQHLTETLLLTLISVSIAIFLVYSLQPVFNNFTGKALSLSVLNKGYFWLIGIAMIFAGSFIAGSYVAFTLTSFNPANTIRSKGQVLVKGFSVRQALVVFQFTASIVFIIATLVLYKQLSYMKNENLGMNLNQLLVIAGPTVASDNQAAKNNAFKNALAALPFVQKQTASNNVPGVGYNFQANGIGRLNATEVDKRTSFEMFICDQNFFNTYGIGFLQGAAFTKQDADASWNSVKKVIINESAARKLGFDPKQNLVGEKINWGAPYEIIGVVKDYHHLSLREAIEPTIYLGSSSFGFFTLQTDTKNMQAKIATLKALYTKTFPDNPFDYFFADERYDQQYEQEQQLGKVFIASALVAVLIACLGLFGLATFASKQRTKEIGIRKVLGATVTDITTMISKDFVKLVILSIVIASPLAYWAMQKWLQNFAYQTKISGWIFIISGAGTILIALATVSFQAIKAASANPVKSLKVE